MQTIAQSTTTADAKGEFTEGSAQGGKQATVITAQWLNALQRELTNAVTAGGITPDPGQYDQLAGSIQALIQQGAVAYAVDKGMVNALAGIYKPAPTLVEGLVLRIKASNANTGAVTLAVNGGVAAPILNLQGAPLTQGDITAGNVYWLQYTTTLVATGAWVALYTSLDRLAPRRATRYYHSSGL